MKKKNIKEAELIKQIMVDALEIPTPEIGKDGKKHVYLKGEFVCHEDILGKEIGGEWHDSFDVCGEDTDVSYLVAIMIVEH